MQLLYYVNVEMCVCNGGPLFLLEQLSRYFTQKCKNNNEETIYYKSACVNKMHVIFLDTYMYIL